MLPKTIGTFQEQFLQTLRNGSQLCCRRRKGQVTNFNRRKTRVLIFTFRTGHLTWYYMTSHAHRSSLADLTRRHR